MTQTTSKVQFIENHLPSLQAGEYRVEISQTPEINQEQKKTYTCTKTFYIASERFTLPLQSTHSVFPPENSADIYSTALPHIVLNRSTLPWERTAGGDPKVPWLALLLFHENDKLDEVEKIDLKTARTDSKYQFSNRFPPESQEQEENISLIKIPTDLLSVIIPTEAELKLLAHVREVNQTIGSDIKTTEFSVVIGNRIPQLGRNTVHLVSLENYFTPEGNSAKNNLPYQYFVSLKSWEFECKPGNSGDRFKDLLTTLNKNCPGTNTLRRFQQQTTKDAEKYLSQGYVPIKHHLRNGQRTVSWYHGPLLPGQNRTSILSEAFPIHTPDQLLKYFTEVDMFDVAYAAAYQLGQLLALQDKKLSASLHQWKRQQTKKQRSQSSTNLAVIFGHLSPDASARDYYEIPDYLRDWFDQTWLLKNIPFNYLVPDAKLLPEESIRRVNASKK